MNRIIKNWDIKILALLSAFIFWAYVVGIENSVYKFPESLDLQPLNMGNNVSLAAELTKINVYIKDDKEIVKSLTKNNFSASIDLKNLKSGEFELPVSVSSKNSQIRIVKLEPETIKVKLSPSAEKEIKIMVNINGKPQPNYEIGDYKLEFEKAKVLGAQAFLDQITAVEAKVALNGTENGAIQQNIALTLPEKQKDLIANVEIVPAEVLVNLNIVQKTGQKQLNVIPVYAGNADKSTWDKLVTFLPDKINVEGDSETLAALETISTGEIDLEKIISQGGSGKIQLDLPANLKITSGQNEVTVKLNLGPSEKKSVAAVVALVGKNAALDIKKINPPSVIITINGPSSLINNLKSGDISVELDVGKIASLGNITIKKENLRIPAGLSVVAVNPEIVALE